MLLWSPTKSPNSCPERVMGIQTRGSSWQADELFAEWGKAELFGAIETYPKQSCQMAPLRRYCRQNLSSPRKHEVPKGASFLTCSSFYAVGFLSALVDRRWIVYACYT